MYLKSIELSGFKSFAKKEKLDFETPITAIVGPNGSGKSNVAEAFRFVLGEQSMKSLRGKRGEDLIFNGSNDVSRSNKANCKIVFDNAKKLLDIDFETVEIERTVFRDGVNEYFINGSSVRLKDITNLLASANIGSSGHHIISQGEADRILNANPKERKVMLDDALGLNVFHNKISESRKKLNKTEENIKEIKLQRREIAPHLKFLQKQVEKIEKVEELRKKVSGEYKEYLFREKVYLDYTENTLKEKLQTPQETIIEVQEKIKKAQTEVVSSEESDIEKKLKESLRKLENIRTEKNEVTRELGSIQGQIESQRNLIVKQKKLQESEDTKMVQLNAVENVLNRVFNTIASTEGQTDGEFLRASLVSIKKELQQFLSEHRQMIDNSLIVEYENSLIELEKRLQEIDQKLSDIESREQEQISVVDSCQREIAQDKEQIVEAEKELLVLQSRLKDAQRERELIISELRTIQIDREGFENEVREAIVLIGQGISNFMKMGLGMPKEEILTENRDAQKKRLREIERLKIQLEEMGVGTEQDVQKEYQETKERDDFLLSELADLEKTEKSLLEIVNDLEEKLQETFEKGTDKINDQFKHFFALMFGGGTASLIITDESKEEDEEVVVGIDINVSLPRKKVRGLQMLSGGERALTSIALLFAISQVNPPPFIILDETDAALDEANSKKYGDMIESLSEYSQLILITHNRETMSRAGILYGVTMGSGGVSKLLSIKFDEAVRVAK